MFKSLVYSTNSSAFGFHRPANREHIVFGTLRLWPHEIHTYKIHHKLSIIFIWYEWMCNFFSQNLVRCDFFGRRRAREEWEFTWMWNENLRTARNWIHQNTPILCCFFTHNSFCFFFFLIFNCFLAENSHGSATHRIVASVKMKQAISSAMFVESKKYHSLVTPPLHFSSPFGRSSSFAKAIQLLYVLLGLWFKSLSLCCSARNSFAPKAASPIGCVYRTLTNDTLFPCRSMQLDIVRILLAYSFIRWATKSRHAGYGESDCECGSGE